MQFLGLCLLRYLNRHYKLQRDNQLKENQYPLSIELEYGEVKNHNGFQRNIKNNIYTTKLYSLSFLSDLIIHLLTRIGNIFFLVGWLIIYCFNQDFKFTIQIWSSIILQLLLLISKKTIFEIQKKYEAENINNRKVAIFTKFSQQNVIKLQKIEKEKNLKFISLLTDKAQPKKQEALQIYQITEWKNIEVGDLILLKRGETSPADILILDISDQNCYIQGELFHGKTQEIQKFPLNLTYQKKNSRLKMNGYEFKKVLNGIIQYDWIDSTQNNEAKGFVRLKKDPKAEDITVKNIIFREQVLTGSDYLFGIAIQTGMKSLLYQSLINYSNQKKSLIDKKADLYFIISFLIVIFLALVIFIYLFMHQFSGIFQIHVFCSELTVDNSNGTYRNFIYYLQYYLPYLPLYYYFLIDITMIICQFKLKKSKTINFINDSKIEDINLCKYIAFDKTGTLTQGQGIKLNALFFETNCYKFKQKLMLQGKWEDFKRTFNQSGNQFNQIEQKQDEDQNQRKRKLLQIPSYMKMQSKLNKSNLFDQFLVKDEKFKNSIIIQEQQQQLDDFDELNIRLEDIDDSHQLGIKSKQPKEFIIKEQINSPHESQDQNSLLINFPMTQNENSNFAKNKLKRSSQLSYSKRQSKLKNDINDEEKEKEKELVFESQEQFYQDLKLGQFSHIYQEALICFVLCHTTDVKYIQSEDSLFYQYQKQLEDLLINFSKNFDIKFVCSMTNNNQTSYAIQIIGELFDFQILAINHERNKRQRLGILVKFPIKLQDKYNEQEDENDKAYSVLYLREEIQSLPSYLDFDKENLLLWEKKLQKIQTMGLRSILFSKVQLNEYETSSFINEYQNIQQEIVVDESKLFQLYNQVEKNCQFLFIAGVQEKLRKGINEILNKLIQAEMKLCILSGDSFNRVLTSAYKTGIISKEQVIIKFDHLTIQDLKIAMKQNLQIISSQSKNINTIQRKSRIKQSNGLKEEDQDKKSQSARFSQNLVKFFSNKGGNDQYNQKDYIVFVSEECLNIIDQNINLLTHFCFISYFAQMIIGYDLSMKGKKMIIQMIQKRFPGNQKVLTIGNSFSDIQMFSQSDFSIQLQQQQKDEEINLKDRFDYIKRKNSKFYQTSKLIARMEMQLKKKKQQQNPTKAVFKYPQIWKIPTANLEINSIQLLPQLIFIESRQIAEFIDDILVFSFYRSLIAIYTSFIINCYSCYYKIEILSLIENQLYQLYFFIIMHGLFIVDLLQFRKQQNEFHQNLYNQSLYDFKKNKLLNYFLKPTLNAFFDSILLGLLFINFKIQIFIYFLTVDLIKFGLHKNNLSKKVFFLIFIIFFLSYIIIFFPQLEKDLENYFTYLLFTGIFYINNSVMMFFQNFFTINLFEKQKYENIYQIYDEYPSFKKNKKHQQTQNQIRKIFQNINEKEIDLSIQQLLTETPQILSNQINSFSLQFQKQDLEKQFQKNSQIVQFTFQKWYIFISLLCYETAILVIYLIQNSQAEVNTYLIFQILGISFQFLIVLIIQTSKYQKYFYFINSLIVLIRVMLKTVNDIIYYDQQINGMDDLLITQLCSIIIICISVHFPSLLIISSIFTTLSYLIRYSNFQIESDSNLNAYFQINRFSLVIYTCGIISLLKYQISQIERQDFILDLSMKKETQEINDVLTILLPKFIRDRLGDSFDYAQNEENIAILFCDICQFDALIAQQNINTVQILDQLFRVFDSQCSNNGMQKIETVGKTYMAAAGLQAVDQNTKFENINPVKRAIQQALDMMNFVKTNKFGSAGNIQIKIGIHVGKVIAAVIGEHKPQFSLIGDTVNTTSRVCSTGEDIMITISQEAYQQIDQKELKSIFFKERIVVAKGKGIMKTYQVIEVKKQTKDTQLKKKYHNQSHEFIEEKVKKQNEQEQGRKGSIDLDSRQNSILNSQGKGREMRQKVQRKIKQNQTRLLQHQHSGNSIYLNQQLQIRSGQNLESFQDYNQAKMSKFRFSRESFKEMNQDKSSQNLIVKIQEQLSKEEIIIPQLEEQLEYEIDPQRILKQFETIIQTSEQKMTYLELDPRKLYLGIKENQQSEEFQNLVKENFRQHCRIVILGTSLILLIQGLSLIILPKNNEILLFLILKMIWSLVFLVMFWVLKTSDRIYKQGIFLILYLILYIQYISECIVSKKYSEIKLAEGLLLYNLLTILPIIPFTSKLFITLGFEIITIIIITLNSWPARQIYYITLYMVMQFGLLYTFFYTQINNQNNMSQIEKKQDQQSNLLMYLLPQHILEEFFRQNQQQKTLTDVQKDATLLFADIAGFTEYSSQHEPAQVVNMLKNLFTRFDNHCLKNNIYKLYTIGDCYVALGVIDANNREVAKEARAIVEFAFDLIDIIEEVRSIIKCETLNMRIGIHTGTVIGGVIGTDVVRYDVYGEDVLIANKMESNGVKGFVQVSEDTKFILENNYPNLFQFTLNKKIEIKSIDRETNGYLIHYKDQQFEGQL